MLLLKTGEEESRCFSAFWLRTLTEVLVLASRAFYGSSRTNGDEFNRYEESC